jgi:hypothetical protein
MLSAAKAIRENMEEEAPGDRVEARAVKKHCFTVMYCFDVLVKSPSDIRPENAHLPLAYPHPDAIIDGWWPLLTDEVKVAARFEGKLSGSCDAEIWNFFASTLKSKKPPMLNIILFRHLDETSKTALFEQKTDGLSVGEIPKMIAGGFEALPISARRYAFSGAKLSIYYKTEYKQLAWDMAMKDAQMIHFIIFKNITDIQRIRFLNQLKENAEWEKANGRLMFQPQPGNEIKPIPVVTGDDARDSAAREEWTKWFYAASSNDLEGKRNQLKQMAAKARFLVYEYELHST